jgi:hypothetical protein
MTGCTTTAIRCSIAWTLAWVAHQLPRAPARLFDANIFYPERKTLAFTETLLLPGVVAAPLHWVGVAPLLVHNLVLLSGFVVSGAGTALLVRSLTGNVAAAILAGIVFAFIPYRIDHLPHLQLQQTQCLPLALWSFHRLLASGRISDGIWFGLFAAGQVLSCMYYGLFLVPYFGIVCGTMLIADRTMVQRRLVALAAGALVAIVAVLPLARAYLSAGQIVGERGRAEVMDGSAQVRNYLAPPEQNLLYGDLFHRFRNNERRLFPGFVVVVLAAVAFWPRTRESTKRPAHGCRARVVSRSARRVSPRVAARVRRLPGLQRVHLPGPLRIHPPIPRVADTGTHGRSGGILTCRARRLRRRPADRVHSNDVRAPRARCRSGSRDAGRVRVTTADAANHSHCAIRSLCRRRQGPRRQSDRDDFRVSRFDTPRSDLHVQLDLSLAESGQRVWRVLSTVVRPPEPGDGAVS